MAKYENDMDEIGFIQLLCETTDWLVEHSRAVSMLLDVSQCVDLRVGMGELVVTIPRDFIANVLP